MRLLVLTVLLLAAAAEAAAGREQRQRRHRRPMEQEPHEGLLLDLVGELGREVSALAEELRRRQGLELAVQRLEERAERSDRALEELTNQLERLREEQWNVPTLVSPTNSKQENTPKSAKTNPFSEEGSGDFAEESLIPVNRVKGNKVETSKETIRYFELIRREHWADLRHLENHTQEKILNVSKQIELMDIKLQNAERKWSGDHENVSEDVRHVQTRLERMQYDVARLSKLFSKTEFNAAQSQAVLDVLEHDWKEESKRIRELQVVSNETRHGLSSHNVRLLGVEAATANLSLQRCRADSSRQLQLEQVLRARRADEAAQRALREGLATLAGRLANATARVDRVQGAQQQVTEDLGKFIKHLPTDCPPDSRPGPVLIQLQGRPLAVFCSGPWLTVQRRFDGSVSFDRGWEEYREGFGDPSAGGEFWLGTVALHWLGERRLRVDMVDAAGRAWRADYARFAVAGEGELYALHVAGHSGNASDALAPHAGMAFSTPDRDNDASSAHCARHHTAGWWYQHCHRADLNGRYSLGMTWYSERTREWLQLVKVEMKVAAIIPTSEGSLHGKNAQNPFLKSLMNSDGSSP